MADTTAMPLAFDRARLASVADWLAVGVAVAMPWSISASQILTAAWLFALIPTLDVTEMRRELRSAAGALPVLAIAMTLLAAAYLCVQYLLALERANFLWALAVAAIAEPLVLQAIGAHLTGVAVGLLIVQACLAAIVVSLGFRSAAAPRASGAAAAA